MLDNHGQYSLTIFSPNLLSGISAAKWLKWTKSPWYIYTSINSTYIWITTTKIRYQKSHLSNASDKFFKRMWLPQLIYPHIQIRFAKNPFSRFVVSLENLGERPWVTERPWKTLSHRKFMGKLKNLSNVRWTEKNNSKQTKSMIGKHFLAFAVKWFVLDV